MPSGSFQSGHKLKIYRSSAAVAAASVWVEMKNVGNVNRPDGRDALEGDARASDEHRFIPGMLNGEITFPYLRAKGVADAGYEALKLAKDTGGAIEIALCDGDITVADNVFRRDYYMVEKLDEVAELAQAHQFQVTLKPTVVFDAGGVLIDYSWETVEGE